jgi:hypothetical protein
MGPCRSLSEWRAGSSSTWLSSSQILGPWSIHQLSSKLMSSQCPCFFECSNILLWKIYGASSLDCDLWKQIDEYKDQLIAMENFTKEEYILLIRRSVDMIIRFFSCTEATCNPFSPSCWNFSLRERALGFSMTEGALALHVVVQNIVESQGLHSSHFWAYRTTHSALRLSKSKTFPNSRVVEW